MDIPADFNPFEGSMDKLLLTSLVSGTNSWTFRTHPSRRTSGLICICRKGTAPSRRLSSSMAEPSSWAISATISCCRRLAAWSADMPSPPSNTGWPSRRSIPPPSSTSKTAVRFLRANAATYGLDGERFALCGDSAGAHYAVMAAATQTNPAFEDLSAGAAGYSSAVRAVAAGSGPSISPWKARWRVRTRRRPIRFSRVSRNTCWARIRRISAD